MKRQATSDRPDALPAIINMRFERSMLDLNGIL
jgi:hypothetical protein